MHLFIHIYIYIYKMYIYNIIYNIIYIYIYIYITCSDDSDHTHSSLVSVLGLEPTWSTSKRT